MVLVKVHPYLADGTLKDAGITVRMGPGNRLEGNPER